MNAILEESSTTKEEPVENKEEYFANLLRTTRWYDLLENVPPQSYDVEESATIVANSNGELKNGHELANTGNSFEQFETVVAR